MHEIRSEQELSMTDHTAPCAFNLSPCSYRVKHLQNYLTHRSDYCGLPGMHAHATGKANKALFLQSQGGHL